MERKGRRGSSKWLGEPSSSSLGSFFSASFFSPGPPLPARPASLASSPPLSRSGAPLAGNGAPLSGSGATAMAWSSPGLGSVQGEGVAGPSPLGPAVPELEEREDGAAPELRPRSRALRCLLLAGAVLACVLSALNVSSLFFCENGYQGSEAGFRGTKDAYQGGSLRWTSSRSKLPWHTGASSTSSGFGGWKQGRERAASRVRSPVHTWGGEDDALPASSLTRAAAAAAAASSSLPSSFTSASGLPAANWALLEMGEKVGAASGSAVLEMGEKVGIASGSALLEMDGKARNVLMPGLPAHESSGGARLPSAKSSSEGVTVAESARAGASASTSASAGSSASGSGDAGAGGGRSSQEGGPQAASSQEEGTEEEGPTAVCLVGGARSFEATGPSILKHVIKRYEPCDVFLHAPLDADSAKFWALGGASHLATVRIFPNCDVDEALHPTDILKAKGSPQGCQGLLQYFRLVEGCLEMVLARERVTGRRYKWIVRARVDAFWRGPAPALSTLNASAYNIPYGNDFSGYNDRFGAGRHWPAEVSMRRLSVMGAIKAFNKSFMHNSEKAYKMQFVVNKVAIARHHMPFCVLTHRLPSEILGHCDPAVPSIASDLDLDGTKCMPCQACDSRPNDTVLIPLYTYMSIATTADGRYEERVKNIQACNLTDVWKPGVWQERFDAAVGPEMARARVEVAGTSYQDCIARLTQMRRRSSKWDSPPPEAICLRRKLGPAVKLGEASGSFNTFRDLLSPSSVVIAPRLREDGDRSWEMAVQREVGAKVLVWFNSDLQSFDASLAAIGATRVDALKLSAEGHDYRVMHNWIRNRFQLRVCQLLVTFPRKQGLNSSASVLTGAWERLTGNLYRKDVEHLGFQLDSCVGGQEGGPDRCLFYSLKFCAS